MKNPFISIKIFNQNKELVKKIGTRKTRRINSFLQADTSKDCTYKLCARYQNRITNKAICNSSKKALEITKTFLEK